jgi:hypothetical protein
VGLNELFTYVAERVRRATPHQTPHLWAFGSEGDLLLAHSRRRRVKADTLPAELTEAASSSLPATRYGVAVELRDRLNGEDLGQALAAWNVLSGMVEDDSRRVSAFAITAMQQAGLQVSPAALDLGTRPAGQPSVHELVLTGSPLALAANADSADDWLRCDVDPGRVQVTVAPEAPGDYEGTVVLATPIGDHLVPVRVEVVPAAAVPKARRAPRAQPVTPPPVEPVVQQPTQPPAPAPARQVPATNQEPAPADMSSSADTNASRLWWPVAAALVAVAVGLVLVHKGFTDTVWVVPQDSNLGPSRLRDGFILAPVVMIALVVAALGWPRPAASALGASAGVALFFLTWSVIFLGTSRIRDDPSLAWIWRNYLFLALAAIVVVVLELWHRHLLRGRLSWRRPTLLESGLLVPGAVLAFDAARQRFHDQLITVVAGKLFLVLPVITVALTCLATFIRISGDRATVIITTAVAYLGATSLALLYLALSVSAPFAVLTLYGNAFLLLTLAARLAQGRWGRLQLPKRKSSPATEASTPQ